MPNGNLHILLSLLLLGNVPTKSEGANLLGNPIVAIDGYTVDSTLYSPATLQLGKTALLVCRVSGVPQGHDIGYQWTCPNTPCEQTGYAGRKVKNNIIAINTTSTSDGGTYTCTVTTDQQEHSQQFTIDIQGGAVLHSYGRLIVKESVITDKSQLQPPNSDSGDGKIECSVSQSGANIHYTNGITGSGNNQTATVIIPNKRFKNFTDTEDDSFHVRVTKLITTTQVIGVEIATNGTDISQVIIGYHRLDLGLEVAGDFYKNTRKVFATLPGGTFKQRPGTLVPGARYRITAWRLGSIQDSQRHSAPSMLEMSTQPSAPSPPRALTITKLFEDGMEINWLPPQEPNGDILYYSISYTLQNGSKQEITTANSANYYNLTGLQSGQRLYNFTVKAINTPVDNTLRWNIGAYIHNEPISWPVSTSEATASSTDSQKTCTQDTGIITGSALSSLLLFFLSIATLIVNGVLIAKHRKSQKSTLYDAPEMHQSEDFKDPEGQIYEEIGRADANIKRIEVTPDPEIASKDDFSQYVTMK